jgi:hypothetical protein
MNRLMMRALGLAVLLAVSAGAAWAGSEERKGTAGAPELLLHVGPRGTALGNAVTSDSRGVEAAFWNPAGLGALEGTEAIFSHTQYIADMKLNYAAVAVKAGGFGTLGFTAKVLSIGDIIVTTEEQPEGTGEILEPTFTVLGLSWGKQFTDRVNFGATMNYVNETVASARASGVAFDFGVQYATGWNGLALGMAMKNFGPSLEYTGSDFEVNVQPPGGDPSQDNRTFRASSAAFEMPSYFTLAATYDVWNANQQRLAFLGSFQNNNFEFDRLTGGLEWTWREDFALRGSYFSSFGSTTNANGDESGIEFDGGDDLYSGFALGGGARIRAGDSGRLGVDVAWRPVRDFFDDVIEVGLKFSF